MSLLINQPSKLCFGKPVLVRSSSPHVSAYNPAPKLYFGKPVLVRSSPLHCNGFSPSCLPETLPYKIICADPCRPHLVTLVTRRYGDFTPFESKMSTDLMERMGMIGSSNGWLATLKKDVVRLAELRCLRNGKHISLPPLETLPLCQTQIVTNIAMSSPFPEEMDCVVAVKFLGPQLSFCRSANAKESSDWINIRIENPCFFSSRVMFSKKDERFRIAGSGGHLIGSWDLSCKHKHSHKFQRFRFKNIPKMTEIKRELLDTCYTSEHLVESRSTNEIFMVKWYKKTIANTIHGIERMETEALMVFKLEEEEGDAVYTQDIGDLAIFLTKSESFCVLASSCSDMRPNRVKILDVDETLVVDLAAQNWNC